MNKQAIKEIRNMRRDRWIKVTEIAEKVDATPEEISEVILHLMFTEDLEIMPESNRKTLSDMDHLYAVKWGGDENHLITWS